jgi:hypothetical protein
MWSPADGNVAWNARTHAFLGKVCEQGNCTAREKKKNGIAREKVWGKELGNVFFRIKKTG